MTINTWTGGTSGSWSTGSNWSSGKAPRIGDLDIINAGSVVVPKLIINGQLVDVDSTSGQTPATLVLNDSSMGALSAIVLSGTGNLNDVTLHNTVLNGLVYADAGSSILSVDAGTTATNKGLIAAISQNESSMLIDTTQGTVTNRGLIVAGGDGQVNLVFGQSVTNAGTIEADPGGLVRIFSNAVDIATDGTVTNTGIVVAARNDVRPDAQSRPFLAHIT